MAAPFTFVNYDRITDNLLWFGYTGNKESVNLKFVVDLVKQDQFNNEKHFHSENKYYSKKYERYAYSITRNYNCYYVINSGIENFGCILRMSDVQILNIVIDNSIIPWFIGEKRLFRMNDNKMVIVGKYTEAYLPLTERTYLKFYPVVINYENTNSYKEGLRIEMNNPDCCIDITIDKFMEFVYILKNTDMINLAASMINYVKIPPYNINQKQSSLDRPTGKQGNFFDK